MQPRTKFLKFYYKLPEKARKELVYFFAVRPMTLNVIALEVRGNTKLSERILKDLGFEE